MRKFLVGLMAFIVAAVVLVAPSPAQAACPFSCTPTEITNLQNEMFAYVNSYRIVAGVPKLVRNSSLNTAAAVQSNHMVSIQALTHVGPGGTNAKQRAVAAGYSSAAGVGENVGFGYSTSQQRVQGWYQSTTHRTIMLNAAYKSGGIAIRFGSNGVPYYCLVVGTI